MVVSIVTNTTRFPMSTKKTVQPKNIEKDLPIENVPAKESVQAEQDKKRKKKRAIGGYATYIHRVLGQVHPDNRISHSTVDQLNDFLHIFVRRVADGMCTLLRTEKKKTMTSREVQTIIRNLLPGELAKHAVSEGTRAVTKYNASSDQDKKQKGEKKKAETLHQKVGLTFSVARTRTLLKAYNCRVGIGAPIYLTAVVEYLTAEILELAGNVARDNKRITIDTRCVFLAIANDDEMFKLSEVLAVEFAGSGVVAKIHAELLPNPDKKSKKKNVSTKETEGAKRPHRFRPGTVSLKEIRKMQKSNKLMLREAPFRREFKKIVTDNYRDEIRFQNGVIKAIQSFTETRLVRLLDFAQTIALVGKREGVQDTDMKLAAESLSPEIKAVSIPKGGVTIAHKSLERVARRAGVKRTRATLYTEITSRVAPQIMAAVAKNAISLMEHSRTKTVSLSVVKDAFSTIGYNFIP